ncbi:MAG: D-alanyl-D-alanine carboxypeptidase [Rhizobiales bacterium]|nr:D-alanyl-D-alanine carboxypeptidase [Hyphomicrobiales bacterium]
MIMRLLLAGFLAAGAPFMTVSAFGQEFATKAEHAILIDAASGTVLFEKNADEQTPPASMAKMMTLAVVFEALKSGELSLTDALFVSENAWRKGGATSGGSTMFAELNSKIAIEDLIRGIAVQSGNDAAIILAEGMSGTETSFAGRMNALARRIGMAHSNFTNATGLPDEAQYTTVRDLAVLGKYLVEEFPNFYHYFSEPEFTWNNIRQFNRNPVLSAGIGGDGIKTGFTTESGYGLVGSAVQDNQRLIVAINGLKTANERAEETKRIMNWGFRSFQSVELFSPGEVIGSASVFGGEKGAVDVAARRSVSLVLPKGQYGQISAKVSYKGPLIAPIEPGREVGQLIVKVDGIKALSVPVFTHENIETGTLQQRAIDAIYELTIGWLGSLKPSS